MKKLAPLLVIFFVVTLGAVVYFGVRYATNTYLGESATKPTDVTFECTQYGVDHQVIVQSDNVNPAELTAKPCDSITITNKDAKARKFAFGVHDKHTAYNGVTEKIVQAGSSFNFVLNKTGTYTLHDHYQEEVGLKFTVSQ